MVMVPECFLNDLLGFDQFFFFFLINDSFETNVNMKESKPVLQEPPAASEVLGRPQTGQTGFGLGFSNRDFVSYGR